MRNYAESDYAINKKSNGIVYRFADKTIEVTLEDYLKENTDKTLADFAKLKALSDADYYTTDRSNYRQTWKNISYDVLCDDKNIMFILPSAENEVIERMEQMKANTKRQSSAAAVISKLTKIQLRRYLLYHVHGLSTWQIAKREEANQKSIHEGLQATEKKIKKILSKI